MLLLLSISLFYREVQTPGTVVTWSKPIVESFPPRQYRIVASTSHHEGFDACDTHHFYVAIAYNRKD
jgi:hypothetical protein